MIRFLLRRTLHAVALVFVTLTATFLFIHLAPGDPASRYYNPDIDPAVVTTVRRQLGLDRPLAVQYVKTLGSFASGNFGVSLRQHRPVSQLLAEAIPRTLQLAGLALLAQILIGFAVGMWSVSRRHRSSGGVLSTLFLVFYSVPSFYLAFGLIALFSLKLQWLPAAGMSSIGTPGLEGLGGILDRVRHLVLPVAVLALGSAAAMARYTRGSLLDAIHDTHIRTARAKGLPERSVLWRHALRNALPQLCTVVGLSLPLLLAGAVVVEKVFAWPGMGSLVVDAIFARDYPVVLAANFVAALVVIFGSLLADVSGYWADPRTRPGARGGRRGT